MKVKFMTDAPRHNLALMRLANHFQEHGDEVFLGNPQDPADYSVASWIFKYSGHYPADMNGGPGTGLYNIRIPDQITVRPYYSLFPRVDYSLGYSWEYCPRNCEWCVVPRMRPPRVHRSIVEFLNPRFSKILLLNNNTWSDPAWRDTFEEILAADLTLIDQNGYDLRLVDEERADYLRRVKKQGALYFAWDDIADEAAIVRGLKIVQKAKLKHNFVDGSGDIRVYVLVGFPKGRPIDETDLRRCQIIADHELDPYIMIYDLQRKRQLAQFRRLTNRTFQWRRLGFEAAWKEYK